MKAGFSLWGKLPRENTFFITGMGLQWIHRGNLELTVLIYVLLRSSSSTSGFPQKNVRSGWDSAWGKRESGAKHLCNTIFKDPSFFLINFLFIWEIRYLVPSIALFIWFRTCTWFCCCIFFFKNAEKNTSGSLLLDLVFCYQNCSDLLWEKIVLVIEKNFWNSRLKDQNLHDFWDH